MTALIFSLFDIQKCQVIRHNPCPLEYTTWGGYYSRGANQNTELYDYYMNKLQAMFK